MGCVGEMVLLRLMVGGLEERPQWVEGGGWAGAKGEETSGGADGLGRDLSFSQDVLAVRPPRCSAVAGAGADDRQTALSLGRRWRTLWNGQTALSKTGDTTTSVPPSLLLHTQPCGLRDSLSFFP